MKRAPHWTRRQVIKSGGSLSLAALLPGSLLAQTANPYRGPFGASSTAEEVTAGLDLSGKTMLVTGCNSGLGFETMRVLAARGAHVIGAARTMEKARDACTAIDGQATPVACELSQPESIVACSNAVLSMGLPLDALICNAGIMELPELEQVNGIEKQFYVNHIGHYLLTRRLLEAVVAADQGRVVCLSSGRYINAPPEGIQFDNLSGERSYDPLTAYGQSKLANALFAQELSRRISDSNATANSVLPGVIMTNLGRHYPTWKLVLAKMIGWTFMKDVEAGAATSCYVATRPELVTVSGHMFEDCNPLTPEGPHMNNRELASQLWAVSEDIVADYL